MPIDHQPRSSDETHELGEREGRYARWTLDQEDLCVDWYAEEEGVEDGDDLVGNPDRGPDDPWEEINEGGRGGEVVQVYVGCFE
jgi:hypothetical protein